MKNKIKKFYNFNLFINRQLSFINDNSGIAAIAIIVTLTALILALGLAITSIAIIENEIALSQKQSAEAYFYAENGILDAKIKIARDKNYITTADPGCSSGICEIIIQSDPIKKVYYTVAGVNPKTVTASGISETKTRKIQATVNLDTNGKLTISDWQEIE